MAGLNRKETIRGAQLLRALFLLGLGAAAHAQDTVVPLPPFAVQGASLNESPATVSRFDFPGAPADQRTSAGLAREAANFSASTNDTHSFNDTFSLRGLTNTPIFGAPAIGVYLDDLPLANAFTIPVSFAGFERAELHRGPTQNTVFGRAGSAGVLRLLTPAAGAAAGGNVTASWGNYGAGVLAVNASSAAAPRGDAYVAAQWSWRDGYVTNTTLNRTIDEEDSRFALARLRWRPDAETEIALLGTFLRARDGAPAMVPLGGPFYSVARSAEGEVALDAANVSLRVSRPVQAAQLTATTSFSYWDLSPYQSTLAFGPLELTNRVTQRQRTWSEEVKLAGSEKAARRWHTGLFWSEGRTDGAFDRSFGPVPYERSQFRTTSRDLAAYGEATFTLSPQTRLTAGVRAEGGRREMRRREAVPVPQAYDLATTSTALLPKLGLSYDATARTSLFVTAGAGYKPGGFSAFTGKPALAAFGAERTHTLEAGITGTSADRRLTSTLRLFWYEITGYQIERSFATGAFTDDYLVVNAAEARSRGGEWEIAWRAARGLSITAAAGYTDVTLQKFRDPYTGVDYTGKRAPYVPVGDASLRIDYQLANGWFVNAGLTVEGRTYYTEGEEAAFMQRANELLDARLGYAGRRYRLTVYGRNLTDENYYQAISPGTGHGTPGAPRMYGVELTLQF